jgi:hypothetical protein
MFTVSVKFIVEEFRHNNSISFEIIGFVKWSGQGERRDPFIGSSVEVAQ